MSWLFSQALVAAYSADCSAAGEPFAQLNVMATPQPFLRSGKMMAFSRLSQSGVTYAPLTATRGADLLTWFRADFLARTSASRAQARASRASDPDSGANFSGLFARFDPASHMWKTAQHSLLGDSHEFLQTLPRSGLMRGGCLYLLPPVVPGMSGCGSGLLPTLTVHGNNNRKGLTEKSGDGLATALRMLPTLCASDATKWNSMTEAERKAKGQSIRIGNALSTLDHRISGSLNPEWCEWFMGWPIGWTGLQPLATGKFQSWLRAHGKGC